MGNQSDLSANVTYHSHSPGNLLLSGTESILAVLKGFSVTNHTATQEITLQAAVSITADRPVGS